jgi:hypothetical protein
MPFCIKCGTEFNLGDKFCFSCGVNLQEPLEKILAKEVAPQKSDEGVGKEQYPQNLAQMEMQGKHIFSLLVVKTILATATNSESEIPSEYPLSFIRPFARLSFHMGAILGKLNPSIIDSVIEQTASFGTPPKAMLIEITNRQLVEFAKSNIKQELDLNAHLSALSSATPYIAWVDEKIAEADKQGKTMLDLECTFKIGLLCFLYGCVVGVRNARYVEQSYEYDRKMKPDGQRSEMPKWKESVEAIRGWLKEYEYCLRPNK